MLAKLARYIVEGLKETEPYVSSVVVLKDVTFNEKERQLLKQLGEDTVFASIIDKTIMSITIGTVDITDIHSLAKRSGGIHALKILLQQTQQLDQKPKYDPLTGDPLDL